MSASAEATTAPTVFIVDDDDAFSQLKDRGVIQLPASSEVLIKRRDELEDIADAA